jgi:hypothetical protein
MRGRFFSVPIICVLLLACSGHTRYTADIDVVSFLPENQQEVTATVPEVVGLTVYILPEVQFDTSGSGPNGTMRRGIEVSTPSPADPPDEVKLTLELSATIVGENLHDSADLPGTTIDVFIAAPSATNVYAQGTGIYSQSSSPLSAGTRQKIEIAIELQSGDPDYELIQSGVFRIGIRHRINPAAATSVDILYTVQELSITISGYPFGFIP